MFPATVAYLLLLLGPRSATGQDGSLGNDQVEDAMMTCESLTPDPPSEQCIEMYEDFQARCSSYDFSDEFIKDPGFRAEVLCAFLKSAEYEALVEEAIQTADISQYIESETFKRTLDKAARDKATVELLKMLKPEIDAIKEETRAMEQQLTEWVLETEQRYLGQMVGIVTAFIEGEDHVTPPRDVEETTATEKGLPTTDIVFTDMNNVWLFTSNYPTGFPPIYEPGGGLHQFPADQQFVPVNNVHCVVARAAITGYWQNYVLSFFLRLRYYADGSQMDHAMAKILMRSNGEEVILRGNDIGNRAIALVIVIRKCEFFSNDNSYDYMGAIYNKVTFSLDPERKGWLRFNYESFENYNNLENPFVSDDGSPWYFFNVFGSAAKVQHNCTNSDELLGAGIYRITENGTCVGVPMFSTIAANIDSLCTDKLWAGRVNIKTFSASFEYEEDLGDCDSLTIAPPKTHSPSLSDGYEIGHFTTAPLNNDPQFQFQFHFDQDQDENNFMADSEEVPRQLRGLPKSKI